MGGGAMHGTQNAACPYANFFCEDEVANLYICRISDQLTWRHFIICWTSWTWLERPNNMDLHWHFMHQCSQCLFLILL